MESAALPERRPRRAPRGSPGARRHSVLGWFRQARPL